MTDSGIILTYKGTVGGAHVQELEEDNQQQGLVGGAHIQGLENDNKLLGPVE